MPSSVNDSLLADEHPAREHGVLRGVSRALEILLLFREADELGVREISRRLDMNPAAAFRAVSTLTEFEFLQQGATTRTYSLGNAIAELGNVIAQSRGFTEVALSIMSRLREVTMETVTLHRLQDGLRTCVLGVESPYALRMVVPLGSSVVITNGATDLVFRAFGTDSDRLKIAERLSQVPSNAEERRDKGVDDEFVTSTGSPATPDEIELTVERGWAISRGRRTLGSIAIAAPLRLPDGLYALTVVGPSERFGTIDEEAFGPQLKDYAAEMIRALAGLQPVFSTLPAERL